MNQITHWLDASNIYASSEHENTVLRQHAGGLLKISVQKVSQSGLLPTCGREPEREKIEICNIPKKCSHCFIAGLYFSIFSNMYFFKTI